MLARSFCLVLLAEAAGHIGQVAEGLHLLTEALAVLEASTARRKYVSSSFHRSMWKNNAFPRAKLARYLRYAVLAGAVTCWRKRIGCRANSSCARPVKRQSKPKSVSSKPWLLPAASRPNPGSCGRR